MAILSRLLNRYVILASDEDITSSGKKESDASDKHQSNYMKLLASAEDISRSGKSKGG